MGRKQQYLLGGPVLSVVECASISLLFSPHFARTLTVTYTHCSAACSLIHSRLSPDTVVGNAKEQPKTRDCQECFLTKLHLARRKTNHLTVYVDRPQ